MLPTWLFVAYGGGHIAMVLPVAQRVRDLGLARPLILALTTAAPLARAAGFEILGFADFLRPEDQDALVHGKKLAAALNISVMNAAESAAYLGLNYADLVLEKGAAEAEQAYTKYGRQCFHPLPTLRRILREVSPHMVIATNSPRAEQAAIEAAREMGIPAVCIVDLFAVDEKDWIGRPGYADRICVLNESVRQTLLAEGRSSEEVVVTGNPAFDGLLQPCHREGAMAVRQRLVPSGRKLVLYAPSPEPEHHPARIQKGNVRLPYEVLDVLLDWASRRSDVLLALRPHPSQHNAFVLSAGAPAVLTGRDWPLEPLLYACDAICITVSTVGLQGWLVGKPVVQVAGSVFDNGAPFSEMNMARAATLKTLPAIMELALLDKHTPTPVLQPATEAVVDVLRASCKL